LEDALTLARTSALVAPAPDRALVVAEGPDRVGWLNGLLTADVSCARAGQVAFSFLCEKKGKIVCDLHVVFEADRALLSVPAASRASVLEVLDHHLIMEDVSLSVSEQPIFRVYGPRAPAVLTSLGGWAWSVGGEGGGLFLGPTDEADADTFGEALAGALREADGGLASAEVEEGVRVSLGLPRLGVDYGPSNYPQETSLHGLGVSFSKGCYLGQEVLYMLEHRGHAKQRLVRLEGAGEVPPVGAPVARADGAEVGAVTSAVASPTGWTGLGMLKRALAVAGGEVQVGAHACRVHAIVSEEPRVATQGP
jgi:folate-binding protein YgfZ